MKPKATFTKILVSSISVVLSFLFVKAQDTRYMVVRFSGNILDCPHFGPKLSNDAANTLKIQLVDKKDNEGKIIFDVKDHNLDSLRLSYQEYLKKIEFPMSYFREIDFTNDITNNKQ